MLANANTSQQKWLKNSKNLENVSVPFIFCGKLFQVKLALIFKPSNINIVTCSQIRKLHDHSYSAG